MVDISMVSSDIFNISNDPVEGITAEPIFTTYM